MQLLDAHGAAMAEFDGVMRSVTAADWSKPTPCSEWQVSDLVNHLVVEQLWVPELLGGATMDQVGDRFDGDQLGQAPLQRWSAASAAARQAWLEPGVTERTVHVSFGDASAEEYGWQMTMDLAVHGWDLATAIGVDEQMSDQLAAAVLEVFEPQLPALEGSGIFAAPVAVPDDAAPQTRLIALTGRRPRSG